MAKLSGSALMSKTPNSCLPGMVLSGHVNQIMFQVEDVALHTVINGEGGEVPLDHSKVSHGFPKAGYRHLIILLLIIFIIFILIIIFLFFIIFIFTIIIFIFLVFTLFR